MNNKSIDINQRIPLDILEVALNTFLEDNYYDDYVIEQLRLDFNGENRLQKALRIVNKIVFRNPINSYLLENKKLIKTAMRKRDDRNIILISLLNIAFPFSYNTLNTLGRLFSAQEQISREALRKHMAKAYGGNRAMENAIDSVVPMFIEANFFVRPKRGVYEWKSSLSAFSSISKKIYEESFKKNNSLIEIHEYQLMDPYFIFIE